MANCRQKEGVAMSPPPPKSHTVYARPIETRFLVVLFPAPSMHARKDSGDIGTASWFCNRDYFVFNTKCTIQNAPSHEHQFSTVALEVAPHSSFCHVNDNVTPVVVTYHSSDCNSSLQWLLLQQLSHLTRVAHGCRKLQDLLDASIVSCMQSHFSVKIAATMF